MADFGATEHPEKWRKQTKNLTIQRTRQRNNKQRTWPFKEPDNAFSRNELIKKNMIAHRHCLHQSFFAIQIFDTQHRTCDSSPIADYKHAIVVN